MTHGISDSTTISLKLVTGLVVTAISLAGVFWWSFDELREEIRVMGVRQDKAVAVIEQRLQTIEARTLDRYSKTQAEADALRNAILNPGMRFSDPRNPGEHIVVKPQE